MELARRDDSGQRQVVWQQLVKPPPARNVLPGSVADLIGGILTDVFEPGGTAGRLPGLWLGPEGWALSDSSPGPGWIRVPVAGKTGSAWQTSEDPLSDAWIFAWAPASQPRVIVAVMLENAGSGGRVAGPVAMELLRASLDRQHWGVVETPLATDNLSGTRKVDGAVDVNGDD